MTKQEKLVELHSIRAALDKVAKDYCVTSEERKTVKEISLRLFQEQILPLAEELTADLVNKTKEPVESKMNSGVQLIDLGLPSGTLWADRNIGADAPEDNGDYFRWGETVPFTEESKEYEFRNQWKNIAGTVYDAAAVNLGKSFKMPTFEQQKELLECCIWKWTIFNGIKGMLVTGSNGNSIFLPASGFRRNGVGSLSGVGSSGYYWSASAYNSSIGHYLNFNSSYWDWSYYYRAYGFPVRAVFS